VLSGKYAADTDPRSRLAAMAVNLRHRTMNADLADLQLRLADARRRDDHELARQLASEIVATRTQKKVD
jgi:hypothetical protein